MRTRLEDAPVGARSEADVEAGGPPLLVWGILLLTAVIAVVWSHNKLLWQDEIFSFQTDRVPSLAEVFRIQRLYPISLEAPLYHVFSHAAMQVFGVTAFALRLPSLVGYLLMQFCLYYFVRNLAGQRAGLLAMAIPSLTWTLYYAAEGRPYGLLLGSYAMAALCWQVAARRGDGGTARIWALAGLAVALMVTLNVHFYGVLLLIPICGAELVRTLTRRRVDGPLVASIVAGMASMVATVPYIKASGEFKKHYYSGPVPVHMLSQPYRQMLLDYTTYPKAVQSVLVVVILLFAAAVAWGWLRAVLLRRSVVAPAAEWVLIFLLVLTPVFAFVLGRLVTHALEPRHSIGAIVGICTLIAVAAARMLERRTVFSGVMAAVLVGAVVINVARIQAAALETRKTMAELTLPAESRAAVDALADKNIYFQNLGKWEVASLYAAPELRPRLVLVYSLDEEMSRQGHDTMYLTAVHTKHFSDQPIVSYDELRRTAGEHIFTSYHGDWDWTDGAFAQEAMDVQRMGQAFGGDLERVRFR
jgi:Dolichyl-phosphate-mannose-protein mannosyltransferase